MTDTPHKKTTLGQTITSTSSRSLSHPAELKRPPFSAHATAQDSILGGRRILAARHTGGSIAFLADSTATGGVSQAHPNATDWRLQYRDRVEQQAGTVLEVRALTVPSGASEVEDIALGTWPAAGVGGQTRVVVTWENDAADTATETVEFSTDQAEGDGSEDTDDGAAWATLRHHYAALVQPQAAANSSTDAQEWSEWPTLNMEFSDRGGLRLVSLTVNEAPWEHVADDTEVSTTVNGIAPGSFWPVKRPQIEQADGATYEEHRFGTHRPLATATRQTSRVGPRIAHWSSYTEQGTSFDDTEAVAVSITSAAGTSRVSAGANTAWDADEVGVEIIGTARMPEHTAERVSGAGAIPVRVRIYCRWSTSSAGATGTFRFQSSTRSFVEVVAEYDTIGQTFAWVTSTGWLEASVASDDMYPVGQDFLTVSAGTMEVRAWDVTYGDYSAPVP